MEQRDESVNHSIYSCPFCSKSFDGYRALKEHVIDEHPFEAPPVPEGLIQLRVNNEEFKVQVEPSWTLYQFLHDKLGLIGTKLFCDRGACGACTVIMDGRPILSCMTLAIECDGKSIETIEGIAENEHPLIEAYVKHHCMQCGYCTPGFIVTAKALLDRNPNPTEGETKDAIEGNLCRCGTYPQHPKAILEAAKELERREGAKHQ
jgi:aerobic-type carbon monoxide dehydrogenase small subunit (CoxS/CutS family)